MYVASVANTESLLSLLRLSFDLNVLMTTSLLRPASS